MPELPEVETTCRGVQPHVEGRALTALVVRNARLRLPVPDDLAERLVGRDLRRVSRRAKYLLFDFGTGSVILHLGMSGSLRVVAAGLPPAAHDHVDLVFEDLALRLRDPRRFGMIVWQAGDADAHPLLARLGPEPLSEAFDGAWLHRVTRGLRAPIKHVLMDSHRVVGVGNIYASESLFRAGIHPSSPRARSRGAARGSWPRCATPSPRRLPQAAAPCVTSSAVTGGRVTSSSSISSMPARASRAGTAARSCSASSAGSAPRTSVPAASGGEPEAFVARSGPPVLPRNARMEGKRVRRYAAAIRIVPVPWCANPVRRVSR